MPNDLEQRALKALHECLLRQRYYAGRSLNNTGREYLFNLADAALCLPLALMGESEHSFEQMATVNAISQLESMLAESVPNMAYLMPLHNLAHS